MRTQGESGSNIERIICLFFAVVTTYVAAHYIIERPMPPEYELTAARKNISSDDICRRSTTVSSPVELLADTSDVFAAYPLQEVKYSRKSRQADMDKQAEPKHTGLVLRQKQKTEPDTKGAAGKKTVSPPFSLPGKVVAILKPDSDRSRCILISPHKDPDNYLQFSEGDEWATGGIHIRIAKVESRRIIFEDEKGRALEINLDPLKDWKPLLRNRPKPPEEKMDKDAPSHPESPTNDQKPRHQARLSLLT